MYHTTGSFSLQWPSYCSLRASYKTQTQEHDFASLGIRVYNKQRTRLGVKP